MWGVVTRGVVFTGTRVHVTSDVLHTCKLSIERWEEMGGEEGKGRKKIINSSYSPIIGSVYFSKLGSIN